MVSHDNTPRVPSSEIGDQRNLVDGGTDEPRPCFSSEQSRGASQEVRKGANDSRVGLRGLSEGDKSEHDYEISFLDRIDELDPFHAELTLHTQRAAADYLQCLEDTIL